jgi:glutaredoxin
MYTIISREGCENCEKIKSLFEEKSYKFNYVMIDSLQKEDRIKYIRQAKQVGQMSLPIILLGEKFIPTVEILDMLLTKEE